MNPSVAYLIQFGVIGVPVLIFLAVRKARVLAPGQRAALSVAMTALAYAAAYYFAAAQGWRLPSPDDQPSLLGPAATAAFPGFSVFVGCVVLSIWNRGTAGEAKA